MAQGWLLFELTGSVAMLGYLGAAASIPAIIMTLFGGAMADRVNRKQLLMATSLIISFLLGLLAWLDGTESIQASHVIIIAGLISLISGFDWPTRQAIFPSLIEKQDMMSAVALNSVIWQSCRMIMPAIGGVVIALVDTWLVFLLCAFGFLVMFFVVAGLKLHLPGSPSAGSALQQINEGLMYILHNRVFLVFISLSYAAMFFGMAHMQLMPAFTSLLGTTEQGYGLLISATGIGSVLGTLIISSYQDSKHLGKIILGNAALSGLMVYVFAYGTAQAESYAFAYEVAIVSLTLASLFSSMFLISSMTVLQLQVPDHLRGRVMGFHGITFSLMALGGLFAGWLATLSSPPVAISVGISIYLLIIFWITATQRGIRRISNEQVQLFNQAG